MFGKVIKYLYDEQRQRLVSCNYMSHVGTKQNTKPDTASSSVASAGCAFHLHIYMVLRMETMLGAAARELSLLLSSCN